LDHHQVVVAQLDGARDAVEMVVHVDLRILWVGCLVVDVTSSTDAQVLGARAKLVASNGVSSVQCRRMRLVSSYVNLRCRRALLASLARGFAVAVRYRRRWRAA